MNNESLVEPPGKFPANFVALDCLLVPREAVSIPALLLRDNTSGMYASMDNGQTADQAAADAPGGENRHMVEVIQQAERELRQLIEERAEVTKRIGTVKQTIVGLAKLFGDGILDAALLDLVDHRSGSRRPGITRACRRVLMEAGRPMSARDVCDEIQRTAPALLAHHKDPLATINTILGRLVEYGEATVLPGDRGQRGWLWAAQREGR
jgi:hypothetical protein